MSMRRKKNKHSGETMQFTPKGVQMMAALLFCEGWIDAALYQAVMAAFDRGWDWNNPECQKAFTDTQPAAGQADDAMRSASKAKAEQLGRLLTMDEYETIERPHGSFYDENQKILAECDNESETESSPIPVVSEELLVEVVVRYSKMTNPGPLGNDENIRAVCAEVSQHQADPCEAVELAKRFKALCRILAKQPQVQQEVRFPGDWIRIAASARCTVEDGFDPELFTWPTEVAA